MRCPRWLKPIFCRHAGMQFVRPLRFAISADAFAMMEGYRSLWRCSSCGLEEYRSELNDLDPQHAPKKPHTYVFDPEVR